MRKSGWAGAAAGLVSAALLLSACGGGGSSSSSAPAGSSSTASSNAESTAQPGSGGHASGGMTAPPKGAIYFSIQKSAHNGKPAGFVLVESAGYVVYTYGGDTAGKDGTCTGGCAALWPPVTGVALKSAADNLPGTFGTTSTGQITYNGLPLYTFKGEKPHVNHASGMWKDIPLPCSDITTGCPS